MVECFLFVGHAGGKWVPFVAIPGVMAGIVTSLYMIVSGIKGVIADPRRPKRRGSRIGSPERIVQWIARRPLGHGGHR
jgi:hypothetical protein